ncbi:MAG TPA: DUF1800 family protein [Acidimicrobiia bacterium]|nr:DUF1800 family protein [Acidimicrobiia bacterium]
MTLYWHGHFATAFSKVVRPRLMIAQNRLLRDLAGGRFREMCKRVTADAAMLLYLDGNTNQVAAPNENYGREFMELFTLGKDRYSQEDVRQAARAFTGYTVDNQGAVAFNPELHDAGEKTPGNAGTWGPLRRQRRPQHADPLRRRRVLRRPPHDRLPAGGGAQALGQHLRGTFSEFGRRVAEDGSAGTDHGTAAPMFVVGDAVAGGLYGEHPRLDADQNMVRTVDFREVYATMLDGWFRGPSSTEVLRHTPADGLHPIPFLR